MHGIYKLNIMPKQAKRLLTTDYSEVGYHPSNQCIRRYC